MRFTLPRFNPEQLIKLILVGAGTSLFLFPSTFSPPPAKTQPIPVSIRCVEGFTAETKSYYVSICHNRSGSFYVGLAKDGSDSFAVPITAGDDDGVYTARHEQSTYKLDMNKQEFTITRANGKQWVESVQRVGEIN